MNTKFLTYPEIKLLVADDLEKRSSTILDTLLNSGLATDDFLSELNNYLQNGSKQLRSCLIFLFSKALFGECTTQTIKLAAAVELIHNATLVHDDIIDEADIRRGKTALHKKYGNKLAIISGDFLLSLAINLLNSLNNLNIIDNFSVCLNALCRGEIEQYFSQKTTPSIEQYLKKSEFKTASLFIAGLKSLSTLNNDKFNSQMLAFAKHFGTAFQISDDLKNLSQTPSGKPILNDIKSGLYTAPVIYAFGENKNLSEYSPEQIFETAMQPDAQLKTIQLLTKEKELAKSQLLSFSNTKYKQALINLCNII